MMLDDDDAIRAAVGRTNRHLRRWWTLCVIVAVIALVALGISKVAS